MPRPKYGFLTYKCPECNANKTISLACKSRICSQCGKKCADLWVDELFGGLYVVSHCHVVFTMSEEFRAVFEVDQSLFKVLMDTVNNTM
ncbi:MAG: transposase zinc-binding domain-containing protein [Nitrososphaerota archaeon]|nr:transposase zinc-binding domain-containing protein [Nitrososphaerota archaeon]